MLRIFIGWDSRFPEPADVLRYSLIKHASIPLEIRYLKLGELGIDRVYDPLASTEFTYSRFLVPHLCGFRGKAVFMDNDMLALADVKELDELPMESLRTARRSSTIISRSTTVKMYGCPQTSYPRKNWSSLMIMDCAKLRLWTKQVVETSNRRLSSPLPGHSRRADRRDFARLEHARHHGQIDQVDPLHRRRTVVPSIRGPSARGRLARHARRNVSRPAHGSARRTFPAPVPRSRPSAAPANRACRARGPPTLQTIVASQWAHCWARRGQTHWLST